MAWQEAGLWLAACIDLTLAVQGDSERDARAKLHVQIGQYINEAVTVDAAHAEALLSRRAGQGVSASSGTPKAAASFLSVAAVPVRLPRSIWLA